MNFEAWRRFLRARLFAAVRRPQLAADEYRHALAADPGFTLAANGFGVQLFGEQRLGEAEQLFRQSLAAKPRQPLIWYNLGFICDRQGRHGEAVEAFTEATQLSPKFDQAWYGLGHAHAAQGRHEEAASALEKAAALVPQNPHVAYSLGMAYHALGDAGRLKAVIEYLNRYDRRMTRQLIMDSGRSDLEHLIADYKPDFFS